MSPQILSETFLRAASELNRASAEAILPALQEHIGDQEMSGLMGRGDHDAIVQIQAGLARIGLNPTLPERSGNLSGDELRKHLIVVGGPDVNHITASLLTQIPCKLTIIRSSQDRNIVRDIIHGQEYEPNVDETGKLRDYGILIRSLNPHDRSKSVLILAGAHGFGSLAAVVVAFQNEEMLQRQASMSSIGFECLVCHERDGADVSSFQRSSLIFSRELVP
jgi:hypothetical protein